MTSLHMKTQRKKTNINYAYMQPQTVDTSFILIPNYQFYTPVTKLAPVSSKLSDFLVNLKLHVNIMIVNKLSLSQLHTHPHPHPHTPTHPHHSNSRLHITLYLSHSHTYMSLSYTHSYDILLFWFCFNVNPENLFQGKKRNKNIQPPPTS